MGGGGAHNIEDRGDQEKLFATLWFPSFPELTLASNQRNFEGIDVT